MPGGPGAQNGKGAQSDPNYVSRLLSRSECLPGGGKNYTTLFHHECGSKKRVEKTELN